MKTFCLFAIHLLMPVLFTYSLNAQNQGPCKDCDCLSVKAAKKEKEGSYADAFRLYQAYSMCAPPEKQIQASQKIDRLQTLLVKQRDDAKKYAIEAQKAERAEEDLRKIAEGQTGEALKQRQQALQKARIGHNRAKVQETKTQDASLAINIAARSAEANQADGEAQELLRDMVSDTALYYYRSVPFVGIPDNPKIGLSPDGSRLLAAGKDSVVRFYDPYTGLISDSSGRLPGYIVQFQFAEKADAVLIYGSHWAALLDFQGKVISQFVSPKKGSAVAISPDATQWAFGDFEGTVYWRNSDSLATLRNKLVTRADRINSLTFSPDGMKLAVCTPDSTIIFQSDSMHTVQLINRKRIGARFCVFSTTGNELLLVGNDNTLRIWNIPRKDIAELSGPEKNEIENVTYLNADSFFVQLKTEGPTLRSPSCSPHRVFNRRPDEVQQGWLAGQGDKRVVVIVSEARASTTRIRVFNRDGTYRTAFQVPNKFGTLRCVHFDPARGLVFIFQDRDKLITVVFNNKHYQTLFTGPEKPSKNVVDPFLGFLPDKNILFGVLPQLDHAILVDVSGKIKDLEYPELKGANLPQGIALHPHLMLSYYKHDHNLALWRTDGVLFERFYDREHPIEHAFFSPDHSQVLTSHQDHSLKVWNWNSNQLEVIDRDSASTVTCFDMSANERRCAVGFADGRIRLLRLGPPSTIILPEPVKAKKIIFFPKTDSLLVLTSEGEVLLWSCRDTRKPLNRWRGSYDPKTKQRNTWDDLALSPDGNYLLLWGKRSAHTLLCNLGTTTEIKLPSKSTNVAAFSPDGKFVLTGSTGSTCRLWDMNGNGRAIWKGHKEGVQSLAFSPGGKYAVTLDGKGTVLAWDLPETMLAEKIESFSMDDLAVGGFIPEPPEARELKRSDALLESANNFLRLGDTETAHYLFDRLVRESLDESAEIWYPWYLTGEQKTADWERMLTLSQSSLFAIAEAFKSIREYGKAHLLYIEMLQKPDSVLVRDILQGYLEICPLAGEKIDASLPVFDKEDDPKILGDYANIFKANNQEDFARVLFKRAVKKAKTPQTLAGLLSVEAKDPAIYQRILDEARKMPDDQKLELVYELMGEERFDLADTICRDLSKTALRPQAYMALYEISLRTKGERPFDTKLFLNSDPKALRYYVDYLENQAGPDLRDTLQQKLEESGQGNSSDYIELYQNGTLGFSDLLEVSDPDYLRDFAVYFSSQPFLTDDYCDKAEYYRQATIISESLLSKTHDETDSLDIVDLYNNVGWYLLLCGKFEDAGVA
ncbi:MAG: hypothetical protein H7246_04920, partial [Phycisphaerae bacterium]|nr:hypothetical protein [Saprospiraceae bacterium]